jgi:hypothetical protein
MDKSCANHPESMALATCKACDKSVCLMCVVDEKEGTFCSTECHKAFSSGQEVPKFVGAVSESGSASAGVQKIDSIFDDEPSAPSSSAGLHAPPSDDPMPIVAEGTKWRPTGAQCENHADTPAVANCDRCGKAVCALCLLEAAQGTFCSAECMGTVARQPAPLPAPAERAALQGKPVFKFKEPPKSNKGVLVGGIIVIALAGIAGAYYGWNGFTLETPPKPPDPVVDPTIKPDTTKPDVHKPDTNPTVKPDVQKPVTNPDTVKPDVQKPVTNPDPPVYIKPRPVVKAVILPTRTINAWADANPGVWYRMKTVRAGQATLTDTGLKEKGKDFVVLATQSFANGQASAVTETKIAASTVFLRGEESFSIDGQSYLCEIRTPGSDDASPRTWALLSGKNMGAVLKSVSPEGTLSTKRVWEGTWRVEGNELDCLVVEGQIQNGTATQTVKNWYCGAVPLGIVKQELGGQTLTLVRMGSDWNKRPGFDK